MFGHNQSKLHVNEYGWQIGILYHTTLAMLIKYQFDAKLSYVYMGAHYAYEYNMA